MLIRKFALDLSILFPMSGAYFFCLQRKIWEPQVLQSFSQNFSNSHIPLWNESVCLEEFHEFKQKGKGNGGALAITFMLL